MLATAATLAAVVPPGAADSGPTKREDCGTYPSFSIYPTAKVIAIRGVECGEARKVARKYDHKGAAKGQWECFLAHGGGRRLFSCGYGGDQGDVRDFPHALIAKGVGPAGAMTG